MKQVLFILGLVLFPISYLLANNTYDIPSRDTPLHIAAREGKLSELERRLKNDEFIIDVENSLKQTPLHHAIMSNKNNEVIYFLIGEGAKWGTSARFLLGEKEFSLTAAQLALWSGNLDVFDWIKKKDTNLFNDLIPEIGNLVHLVIASGRFEVFEYLLSKYTEELKRLIKSPNDQGRSPMHYAAGVGDIRAMEKLRDLGARFEAEDKQGNTPLHMAVRCNKPLAIDILACWGANLKYSGEKMKTPLELAQDLNETNPSGGYNKIIVKLTNRILKEESKKYEHPSLDRRPIENLVLQGSGRWYNAVVQVGALKSLESKGALTKLRRVAGNAYDAVTASLLAVGYDPDELLELFTDNPGDSEAVCLDGTCDTSGMTLRVREWLDNKLKEKTNKPDLTFGELKHLVEQDATKYRHLYVAAMKKQKADNVEPVYFDSEESEEKHYSNLIISDVVYSGLVPKSSSRALYIKDNSSRVEASRGNYTTSSSEFPTDHFDRVIYWNEQYNEEKDAYSHENQNTLSIKLHEKGNETSESQQDNWRTLKIEIDATDKKSLLDSGINAANYFLQKQISDYPSPNGESLPSETINPCLYATGSYDFIDLEENSKLVDNYDVRNKSADIEELDSNAIVSQTNIYTNSRHYEAELSTINNVPRPARYFQQRRDSDILVENLTSLETNNDGDIISFFITGIPGSGKTELAKKYAITQRHRYSITWVFNAENLDTLQRDFEERASRINPDEFNHPGLNGIMDIEVRRARTLQFIVNGLKKTQRRWLWIFDNAEDYKEIYNNYIAKLPYHIRGTLIITTRLKYLDITNQLNLDKGMQVNEAKDLLYKILGMEIADPNIFGLEKDALALISHLNYLPLAISTSAVYLRSKNKERQRRGMKPMTFSEYQGLLLKEEEKIKLEKIEKKKFDEVINDAVYSDSQAAALQLFIRQLSKEKQIPLELCVFISTNRIPRWLINDYLQEHLPPEQFKKLELDLYDFINEHPLFSQEQEFTDKNRGNDLFFIHRETRDQMKMFLIEKGNYQGRSKEFYENMLGRMVHFFIKGKRFSGEYKNREQWKREELLTEHIEEMLLIARRYSVINEDIMKLLNMLAEHYITKHEFQLANKIFSGLFEDSLIKEEMMKQESFKIEEYLKNTVIYALIMQKRAIVLCDKLVLCLSDEGENFAKSVYSKVLNGLGENHVETLTAYLRLADLKRFRNKNIVYFKKAMTDIQYFIDTKNINGTNCEIAMLKTHLGLVHSDYKQFVKASIQSNWPATEKFLTEASGFFEDKSLYPDGHPFQVGIYAHLMIHSLINKNGAMSFKYLNQAGENHEIFPFVKNSVFNLYIGFFIWHYRKENWKQAIEFIDKAVEIAGDLYPGNKVLQLQLVKSLEGILMCLEEKKFVSSIVSKNKIKCILQAAKSGIGETNWGDIPRSLILKDLFVLEGVLTGNNGYLDHVFLKISPYIDFILAKLF